MILCRCHAVIGVGKATKRLNDFLDCAKVRALTLFSLLSLSDESTPPSAELCCRSILQLVF